MLPRYLLPRLSWAAALPARRVTTWLAGPRPQDHSSVATTTMRRFYGQRAPRRPCAARPGPSPILSRALHATARRQRDHHFDTLKFVQRLQGEGFTEEQSVAMMKVLNDVIEERYELCRSLSLTLFFFFFPVLPLPDIPRICTSNLFSSSSSSSFVCRADGGETE